LNENNVKLLVGFQNYVSEKLVLSNILQKKLDVFNNHACEPLTVEQIDYFLISQIS